jgi:hypothetical protein
MSNSCEVRQIYCGSAFMNVEDDIGGGIMVWGSTYTNKTILVLDGINFTLYQFENEAYFNEWLLEKTKSIRDEIFSLEYDKKSQKTVIVKIA